MCRANKNVHRRYNHRIYLLSKQKLNISSQTYNRRVNTQNMVAMKVIRVNKHVWSKPNVENI